MVNKIKITKCLVRPPIEKLGHLDRGESDLYRKNDCLNAEDVSHSGQLTPMWTAMSMLPNKLGNLNSNEGRHLKKKQKNAELCGG